MNTDNIRIENILTEATDAYHNGCPIMTDAEFDRLWAEHKTNRAATPDDPIWQNTVLDRVGARPLDQSGFAKVRHSSPMLSLDNVFLKDGGDASEVIAWLGKLWEQAEQYEMFTVIGEPKIDGLSVRVTYVDQRLVSVVTRGDGETGDNVTANACGFIPSTIGVDAPALLEVSGEVFMTSASFEEINAKQEKLGEELYANPRNAAGGMLRRKDPSTVSGLSFLAHGVVKGATTPRYDTDMRLLTHYGIPTVEQGTLHVRGKATGDANPFVPGVSVLTSWLYTIYEGAAFPVDGVVLKLPMFADHERLGATSRAPRWAVAVKFRQEEVETTLRGITVQVGRSGVLTPVAELEPVLVDGSTVSRATLHNEAQINRLGVRPGDRVVIRKAGAIIPEVVRRVETAAPDSTENRLPIDLARIELNNIGFEIRENGGKVPEGTDVHRRVAARVHAIPEGSVTEEQRRAAEALTFMAAYSPDSRGSFHLGSAIAWECPSCGQKSVVAIQDEPEGDRRWICNNALRCPAQMSARIEHMASRDCLNLDQLGGEACDAIANQEGAGGLIRHPFDILSKRAPWFARLTWTTESGGSMTFGESRAAKVEAAIQAAENLPLHRWIAALGIPTIGKNTSKEISRLCRTPESVMNACQCPDGLFWQMINSYEHEVRRVRYEKLKARYAVSSRLGPVSLRNLVDFFDSDAGRYAYGLIPASVRSDNFSPEPPKVTVSSSDAPLSGKNFVITGTLSLPREHFVKVIEEKGGKVAGSVSKNTDYLLAGEKAGSKLAKAGSLGVQVLSEAEFSAMLG